jgi:hypothetical protein
MMNWADGFNLLSGIVLCLVVAVGTKAFLIAMSKTKFPVKTDDITKFDNVDVLMFAELKEVALKRAAAENISSLSEQMVQIKRCDDKIIKLSKRLNYSQQKVG